MKAQGMRTGLAAIASAAVVLFLSVPIAAFESPTTEELSERRNDSLNESPTTSHATLSEVETKTSIPIEEISAEQEDEESRPWQLSFLSTSTFSQDPTQSMGRHELSGSYQLPRSFSIGFWSGYFSSYYFMLKANGRSRVAQPTADDESSGDHEDAPEEVNESENGSAEDDHVEEAEELAAPIETHGIEDLSFTLSTPQLALLKNESARLGAGFSLVTPTSTYSRQQGVQLGYGGNLEMQAEWERWSANANSRAIFYQYETSAPFLENGEPKTKVNLEQTVDFNWSVSERVNWRQEFVLCSFVPEMGQTWSELALRSQLSYGFQSGLSSFIGLQALKPTTENGSLFESQYLAAQFGIGAEI